MVSDEGEVPWPKMESCCGKSNPTPEKLEDLFSSVSALPVIMRVSRFGPYLLTAHLTPTCLLVSLHHETLPEFTTKIALCQTRKHASSPGTVSRKVLQDGGTG